MAYIRWAHQIRQTDCAHRLRVKERDSHYPIQVMPAKGDPPRRPARRRPPRNLWRRRADGVHAQAAVRSRPAVVAGIKAFHTLAWLSIESCAAYVLYAGFAGRSDRRVGLAAAVVAGETLVFAGNGFQCPLTQLAERYGAERGSVTDIYLPRWFAHNMPAIHAPLLMIMAYLHARNLIRSGRTPRNPQVTRCDQ